MKQLIKKLAFWTTVLIIPPILISFSMMYKGLVKVIQTGMCPPAPTDIPAYACSVSDYIYRMTVGGFAIIGNIIIVLTWFAFVGSVTLIRKIAKKKTLQPELG